MFLVGCEIGDFNMMNRDVFNWKAFATKKNQFFLDYKNNDCSYRNNKDDGNHHAFLKMEAEAMDLPADCVEDQRKISYVRKWNKLKKKYVMTPVDPTTGQSLKMKQVKRRNEAGVIIRYEIITVFYLE